MKSLTAALFGMSLMLVTPMANAAYWYDRVSTQMERVEMDAATNTIVLMVNGPAIWVGEEGTSACQVVAIVITPPTGRHKEWLAMVLAATMSGNAVSVYGSCNQSAYTLEANRMIVDY